MKPPGYIWVRGRLMLERAGSSSRVSIVTEGDVGVVIIFKGASRSMIATGDKRVIVGQDVSIPDDLHVFVREPIERLRSVYQFFNRQPPIKGQQGRKKVAWEEFIDKVLDGAENPHWRPVSETLAMVGKPVTPHLFENLNAEYPFANLPHNNKSQPVGNIDLTYREAEIQAKYADDYALRDTAAAAAPAQGQGGGPP